MWANNSVIFIKLPKVNNRPMGENSANLVTLVKSNSVEFSGYIEGPAC
jgi:hypothetical protein